MEIKQRRVFIINLQKKKKKRRKKKNIIPYADLCTIGPHFFLDPIKKKETFTRQKLNPNAFYCSRRFLLEI